MCVSSVYNPEEKLKRMCSSSVNRTKIIDNTSFHSSKINDVKVTKLDLVVFLKKFFSLIFFFSINQLNIRFQMILIKKSK